MYLGESRGCCKVFPASSLLHAGLGQAGCPRLHPHDHLGQDFISNPTGHQASQCQNQCQFPFLNSMSMSISKSMSKSMSNSISKSMSMSISMSNSISKSMSKSMSLLMSNSISKSMSIHPLNAFNQLGSFGLSCSVSGINHSTTWPGLLFKVPWPSSPTAHQPSNTLRISLIHSLPSLPAMFFNAWVPGISEPMNGSAKTFMRNWWNPR